MGDDLSHRPAATRKRSRRLRSVFRTQQALELAARGFSSEQIADRITAQELRKGTGQGITARGVDTLIRRALERYEVRDKDTIEHVRSGQLQRLMALEARLWEKASKGNLRVIDRVLQIERQVARIAGTEEPPTSRQHDRGGALTDDDRAQLDRLERAFREAATVTLPSSAVHDEPPGLPSAAPVSFPDENASGEIVERSARDTSEAAVAEDA